MQMSTAVWARFTKRRSGLVKLRGLIDKPSLGPLIHTRARLNLGNLLRGEQRFDEAKSLFLEVLANDPRPTVQYEGHYYLGYLHLDQRDYLRAYDSFTTAVEAEQRAEGFYALANACHQLGRQDEQIRYLWQTVDIDPEFAAAHRNLGALYLQRGEHSLAEEALLQALKLEPDVAIAHYNLGVTLYAHRATRIGPDCLRNRRAATPGWDISLKEGLKFRPSGT